MNLLAGSDVERTVRRQADYFAVLLPQDVSLMIKTVCVLLSLIIVNAASLKADHPNIVIILADDFGVGDNIKVIFIVFEFFLVWFFYNCHVKIKNTKFCQTIHMLVFNLND